MKDDKGDIKFDDKDDVESAVKRLIVAREFIYDAEDKLIDENDKSKIKAFQKEIQLKQKQFKEDAKLCLAHFLNYWRNGESYVNPKVADWIDQALDNVILGNDADTELGTKNPKNRPADHDKSYAVAARIELFFRDKNISGKTIKKPGGKAKDDALSFFDLSDKKSIEHQLDKLSNEDELAIKKLERSELLALADPSLFENSG